MTIPDEAIRPFRTRRGSLRTLIRSVPNASPAMKTNWYEIGLKAPKSTPLGSAGSRIRRPERIQRSALEARTPPTCPLPNSHNTPGVESRNSRYMGRIPRYSGSYASVAPNAIPFNGSAATQIDVPPRGAAKVELDRGDDHEEHDHLRDVQRTSPTQDAPHHGPRTGDRALPFVDAPCDQAGQEHKAEHGREEPEGPEVRVAETRERVALEVVDRHHDEARASEAVENDDAIGRQPDESRRDR